MFTSGQSTYAMFAFSFLTFFVAIPTAIKEFSWVATIWKGSIALNSPMLYTLAFLIIFAIGGLTGVILGALNVDIHLHDTYFVVAHFHYVMMGSIALAFFAGLHHWWPKMFGVMYDETWPRSPAASSSSASTRPSCRSSSWAAAACRVAMRPTCRTTRRSTRPRRSA
jgi:cytochrome c oxidase subunit 1